MCKLKVVLLVFIFAQISRAEDAASDNRDTVPATRDTVPATRDTVTDMRTPFMQLSWGFQKIKGISGLPLTTSNICDTRDACDIISPGGSCVHTALDRGYASLVPSLYPIMTCSSAKCSASQPPTGLSGVFQCSPVILFGNLCDCSPLTMAVYTCGICNSLISSTCFCCTG